MACSVDKTLCVLCVSSVCSVFPLYAAKGDKILRLCYTILGATQLVFAWAGIAPKPVVSNRTRIQSLPESQLRVRQSYLQIEPVALFFG